MADKTKEELIEEIALLQKRIVELELPDSDRKRMENDHMETITRQSQINMLQQSLLVQAPLGNKLKAVTDGIVRLFNADFCRIWLIRPGDLCEQGCIHAEAKEGPHVCIYRDRCLHLLASSGRYTHIDGNVHRRVPFGCYKIGRIASGEDHKFLTNDAQNDPRVHNHEWARELGLVSFGGYQLRVSDGETLGVLALFSKHPITLVEDAMLDGISSSVALLVQQAITEKRQSESHEQFRELFNNMSSGVVVYRAQNEGEDFILLNMNKAGERISKVNREHVVGKSVLELFPGVVKMGLFEVLQKVWKTGKPQHQAAVFYEDGRLSQWVENDVYRLHSGEIVAVYTDITEREETKEKERKHLQELEVFYRASVGREERIIELKKEIEQLKKELGK